MNKLRFLSGMRRPFVQAVGLSLLLSLILVGVALALSLGYADGVWSNASGANGAPSCIYYNNTASHTDENQVRYGWPASWPFWNQNCPNTSSSHDEQSGFGFDGNDGVTIDTSGVPFLLGQFTHYNNPIYIRNNRTFTQVDLDIELNFDTPDIEPKPVLGYVVNLDETNNGVDESSDCEYDAEYHGSTLCPDKVWFANSIPDQTFGPIDGKYYRLQIIGFQVRDGETCEFQPNGPVNVAFFTEEQQNNYACLYARLLVDAPSILIEKTPEQQYVTTGGTANFNIAVTNNGNVDLVNVSVSDPLAPGCDTVIGNLAIGATYNYSCSVSGVNSSFTNVATATGTSSTDPNAQVKDDDPADVTVQDPVLTIIKDADPDHYRDFNFATSTNSSTPLDASFLLDDDASCAANGPSFCDGNQAVLDNNKSWSDLQSGTYTVTESFDPSLPWLTDNVNCVGEWISDSSPFSPSYQFTPALNNKGGTVVVGLEANQHVTCTFSNISDSSTAIGLSSVSARPSRADAGWLWAVAAVLSGLGAWIAWRRRSSSTG